MTFLYGHQTLTESLLSTCVFLSWLRHVPPWLLCHYFFSLPLPVFSIPSFPGQRDRPGLLSFLEQTSHKGSGASFPVRCRLFLCAHSLRDQVSSKPNMLLCVYSISEVRIRLEKGAQRSPFSISPFEMQNSLQSARYIKSYVLAWFCDQHYLLPDGRK